jgi:hypothetical protein
VVIGVLVGTATVTTQGLTGLARHDETKSGDFYLAKTGDPDLATNGDFSMATDRSQHAMHPLVGKPLDRSLPRASAGCAAYRGDDVEVRGASALGEPIVFDQPRMAGAIDDPVRAVGRQRGQPGLCRVVSGAGFGIGGENDQRLVAEVGEQGIVLVRLRTDERARTYAARRKAEGITPGRSNAVSSEPSLDSSTDTSTRPLPRPDAT